MQCEKNQSTKMENGEKKEEKQTPLMALNHISRVCRSLKDSVDFYTKILGFVLIERPDAFDFDGAWLFNCGIGIHLVHDDDEGKLPRDKEHLDPMDNHISFQGLHTPSVPVTYASFHLFFFYPNYCESVEAMEQRLKENNIRYRKRTVGDEEEAAIDQLFFNDPDGFMIEICNCENLKLVPKDSLGRIKLPFDHHTPPVELDKIFCNSNNI